MGERLTPNPNDNDKDDKKKLAGIAPTNPVGFRTMRELSEMGRQMARSGEDALAELAAHNALIEQPSTSLPPSE